MLLIFAKGEMHMAIMPQAQWEIEGELLQIQITLDKLNRQAELSEEQQERRSELAKRKEILQELLRKEKMKLR